MEPVGKAVEHTIRDTEESEEIKKLEIEALVLALQTTQPFFESIKFRESKGGC